MTQLSPASAVRFVTFEHDHAARQPVPELMDIWPRVQTVIFGQSDLNNYEAKFRQQHLRMANERRLTMPSPFSDGIDACVESYYCSHQFFYRFAATEEYFWVTTIPEQLIASLYFPARKLVLSIYDSALGPTVLEEFERLRAQVTKPNRDGPAGRTQCALVFGYPQFMHMLWNHLPALQLAVLARVATQLPVAVGHEPFGPTGEIFPELATVVRPLPYEEIPALNQDHAMLVGMGARTITRSLRHRIRTVALRYASASVLADREHFRSAHSPIFWMTVKPPNRTAHNQIDAMAVIIEEIRRRYPNAGFLLDGASLPWDFARNPNYDGFFREYLGQQVRLTGELVDYVSDQLDPRARSSLMKLVGLSACDEIAWADIASFYFCHAGTPHHKIGWLHEIPGMIYSNSKFIAYYQWLKPLEHHPPIYFLPASRVADDPDGAYTPEQLARKDQNFTLLAPAEIAQDLLAAYHDISSSLSDSPQASLTARRSGTS